MTIIDFTNTNHEFEKANLVTQKDKKGTYDLYRCKHCKLEGKRRSVSPVLQVSKNKKCTNVVQVPSNVGRFVVITKCMAVGEIFSNLTPNSKHQLIKPPKYQEADEFWVMGVGEPVRILPDEFYFEER